MVDRSSGGSVGDWVTDAVLTEVDLPGRPSAWLGHVPFAVWLVGAIRPLTLVELGAHFGHSYFSFCASVLAHRLPTRCYAVDTWEGDPHAGLYGEAIFSEVSGWNRTRYDAFSRLLRMRFDEAREHFADGSIDLLHIDGWHTYEAVRHDFESWKPKLSGRAVVLLHDINVRERDFGVWRFWDELRATYPWIEFQHSHGLGVVLVGEEQPALLAGLAGRPVDDPQRAWLKQLFARLGRPLELEAEIRALGGMLHAADARARDAEASRDRASEVLRESQLSSTRAVDDQRARAEMLEGRLAELGCAHDAVLRSSWWRLGSPVRWAAGRLKGRNLA